MFRPHIDFAARLLSTTLLLGSVTTGCVDKEKCEEAIRVTRDALSKEQTDLARQWRDRAWNMCDDAATIANLDKEILDKEAAIKKRAEDEAKAAADAAQSRMNTAQRVWKNFDKVEAEKQTMDLLEEFKEKADKMKEGLPEQYAKQIDDLNEKQFKARKRRVEKLEAGRKKK